MTINKIRKKSENSEPAGPPSLKGSLSDIMSNKADTVKEFMGVTKSMPPNFRGSVAVMRGDLKPESESIEAICASNAIDVEKGGKSSPRVTVDMGKCILCGRCQEAAPEVFQIRSSFKPAVKQRQMLSLPDYATRAQPAGSYEHTGRELKSKIAKTLGRSLAIREVDAGSCNGCEVEITALNNAIYDIERFGIHFVASPRHADVLLVTGPASRNMEVALRRTFDATPDPKIVVAVGVCACSGGIFGDTYATTGGIDKIVPVDVFIPGCPPTPESILYGLLLAVDRIKERD